MADEPEYDLFSYLTYGTAGKGYALMMFLWGAFHWRVTVRAKAGQKSAKSETVPYYFRNDLALGPLS